MFFAERAGAEQPRGPRGFVRRATRGHARGRAAVQNPRPAEPPDIVPTPSLKEADRPVRSPATRRRAPGVQWWMTDVLGDAAAAAGGTTTRTSSRSRRTSARIPRSETARGLDAGSKRATSEVRAYLDRSWETRGRLWRTDGGVPRRLGLAREPTCEAEKLLGEYEKAGRDALDAREHDATSVRVVARSLGKAVEEEGRGC